MPKYYATIKQTEYFLVSFDTDEGEDLEEATAEAFGTTDAESLHMDVNIEEIKKVADYNG